MEPINKSFSNIKCRSIQIFNHQIKDGKVIYTIEIKLNNKQSIIITERYSELLNLHNAMSKEAKLPNFPPKKFFGNTDEKFLIQRQLGLNEYYEIITSSHIYSNLPSFKSWIFSKFENINLEKKEIFEYNVSDDISQEKILQDKIIFNQINKNVIPLFFDININFSNDDLDQDNNFQNKEIKENRDKKEIKENKYLIIKNDELEKNKYLENKMIGNNNNFNLFGNKKNNLLKMEKALDNKLNELILNINIKCIEKFQSPDILMMIDL